MIEICDCISCISLLWKGIYVSWYDGDLTRMFVKITEDGFETYSPNVYLVEKDKVSKLEEDDINVCFDKIRGKF